MRAIYCLLAVLFCAALVRAESLEGLSRRIDSIVQGRDNGDQIKDLRVQDDAVVGDDLTVSGSATVSETITGANLSTTGKVSGSVFQGSLAGTGISGTLCASMPVSATYSTATNGAITIQAKDPAGANLARAIGFEFWFTTAAVVTTPATNEIQSFSVQNGDMRMYREIGSAVPTYVAQTDNTGKFLVNTVVYTNGTSSLTNYFHLLGPNGYYTNFQCKYNP